MTMTISKGKQCPELQSYIKKISDYGCYNNRSFNDWPELITSVHEGTDTLMPEFCAEHNLLYFVDINDDVVLVNDVLIPVDPRLPVTKADIPAMRKGHMQYHKAWCRTRNFAGATRTLMDFKFFRFITRADGITFTQTPFHIYISQDRELTYISDYRTKHVRYETLWN